MKRFFPSPDTFFRLLLAWEKTSLKTRRAVLADGLHRDDFLRDLLFLRDSGIPAGGGRESCVRYVAAVYGEADREMLLGHSGNRWIPAEELFDLVSSLRGYRRFMSGNAGGEAKEFLSFVTASPEPVTAAEASRVFGRRGQAKAAPAFGGCLAGGMIVLLWDRKALTARIGIWPHVCPETAAGWNQAVRLCPRSGELTDAGAALPRRVEAVLIHAACGGIRLRENGRDLYRRDFRGIFEDWPELPSLGRPGVPPEETAAALARNLLRRGLLAGKEKPGGGRLLEISPEGLSWLRKDPGGRLRDLAETAEAEISAGPLLREVRDILGRLLGGGEAFSPEDLTEYAAFRDNPFLRAGETPQDLAADRMRSAVEAWLFDYLLPLGGLRFGRADGKEIVALSPVGVWLLGGRRGDPGAETGAGIRIRRDGRIVPLRPDPAAERKLRCMCEEKRDPAGAGVFRVTRRSVERAAAEGYPVDALLFVLEDLSAGDLPPGLAAEIKSWHRSAPGAEVFSGTVLDCGGPGTAKKIAALLGGRPRVAGGRYVLLDEADFTAEFAARCRAEGIRITGPRNPASRSNPARFPPA